MDDTAADGSPVAVYLAVPPEPDLGRICAVIPSHASVLDLGSGPGRLANPLAAGGHEVVAVDDSASMLDYVVGPETVLADIWTLRLDRRFDVVLALSHLINAPDRARRSALLGVCREHVADDGIVIVQRYAPDWAPTESNGQVGDVSVRLHDIVVGGDGSFAAIATYGLGGRTWSQPFTAAIVDDDELASLAAEHDLHIRETLDDASAWVVLGCSER